MIVEVAATCETIGTVFNLESQSTSKVVGKESEKEEKSFSIVFLSKCFLLSPDPQVVLSGLHEIRHIAAISTEHSHQW